MHGLAATSSLVAEAASSSSPPRRPHPGPPRGQQEQLTSSKKQERAPPIFPAELAVPSATSAASASASASADVGPPGGEVEPLSCSHRLLLVGSPQPERRQGDVPEPCEHELVTTSATWTTADPSPSRSGAIAASSGPASAPPCPPSCDGAGRSSPPPTTPAVVAHLGDVDEAPAYRLRQQRQVQRRQLASSAAAASGGDGEDAGLSEVPTAEAEAAVLSSASDNSLRAESGDWDATHVIALLSVTVDHPKVPVERTRRFSVWSSGQPKDAVAESRTAPLAPDVLRSGPRRPSPVFPAVATAAATPGRAPSAPTDAILLNRVDPLSGLVVGFAHRARDGVANGADSTEIKSAPLIDAWEDDAVQGHHHSQSGETQPERAVGRPLSTTATASPILDAPRSSKVDAAVEKGSVDVPAPCGAEDSSARMPERPRPPWTPSLGYDALVDHRSAGAAAAAPQATHRFAVLDFGSGGNDASSPSSTKTAAMGNGDWCRTATAARDVSRVPLLLQRIEFRCGDGLHDAIEPLLPVLRAMVGAGTAPSGTEPLTSAGVKELSPHAVNELTDASPSHTPNEASVVEISPVTSTSIPINVADEGASGEEEVVKADQRPARVENWRGGVDVALSLSKPERDCVLEPSVDPTDEAASFTGLVLPSVTMFSISESENVTRRITSAVALASTAQFVVWGTGEEKHPARRIDPTPSRRRQDKGAGILVMPPPFDPCVEPSYEAILLRDPLNALSHTTVREVGEGVKSHSTRHATSIAKQASPTEEEDTALASAQYTLEDFVEEHATDSLEKECMQIGATMITTEMDTFEAATIVDPVVRHTQEDTNPPINASAVSFPTRSVANDVVAPITPTIKPEALVDAAIACSPKADDKSYPSVISPEDSILAHSASQPEQISQQHPDPTSLGLTEASTLVESSSDRTVADANAVCSTAAIEIDYASPPKEAQVMKTIDRTGIKVSGIVPTSEADFHPYPVGVVPNGNPLAAEPSQDSIADATSDKPETSCTDANCRSPSPTDATKENTNEGSSRTVVGANKSISSAAELLKDADVSSLHANGQKQVSSWEKSKIVESAQALKYTAVDEGTLEQRHSTPDLSGILPQGQVSERRAAVKESGEPVDEQTPGPVDITPDEAILLQKPHSASGMNPFQAVGPTLAEIVARHAVDVSPVVESTSSKVYHEAVVPPHAHGKNKNKPVNWKSVPLKQSVGKTGRGKRSVHGLARSQAESNGEEGWNTVDRIKGRSRFTNESNGPLSAPIQETMIAASETQPSTTTQLGGQLKADTTRIRHQLPTSPTAPTSHAADGSNLGAISASADLDASTIATSEKTSDITVYGATSFVAQHVLTYLQQVSLNFARPLTITLGGRNVAKLENLKEKCIRKMECLTTMHAEATGRCLFKVHVAESDDFDSLSGMVKCTNVVLNCAGPFAKYSGNLVGACARAGVDYVDITGEVRWAGTMRDKYGPESAKSGSRIISFCGFDSVPSDIAVFAAVAALRKACKKRSVDVARATTWHSSVGGINGGTLHTMIDVPFEPRVFLQRPVPFFVEDPLSLVHPRLKSDSTLHATRSRLAKAEWLNLLPRAETIFALGVSIPFFMSVVNSKVVQASALALKYGPSFTYYERMVPVGYKLTAKLRLLSVVPAILVLLACSIGFLILKLPFVGARLATWLLPPGSGSSDQQCAAGHAEVYAEVSTAPNKAGHCDKANALLKFQGDPGNYVTAQCVCEAALALLFNKDDLPPRSEDGFGTPAELLGFALIRRLKGSPVRPVVLETHVRLNTSREWTMYVE